jgi:uncharacterized protein YdaU (DUF1376 family)
VGCETSEAGDARSKYEDLPMNYYPRHLGDYAAQAGWLSALEHGVYTLLLDWYHKTKEPSPENSSIRSAKRTVGLKKKQRKKS